MTTSQRRVAIIGAGLAGIATAKIFISDGFDVTVYEKEPDLGGVWTRTRAYPGLRTNTAKKVYRYSDLAYPDDVKDYPGAEDVYAYLRSYAEKFGVLEKIQFSREINRIERLVKDGKTLFTVSVQDSGKADSPEELEFDFVVVCNGVFSTPKMPEVEGKENFKGSIRHTSNFIDVEIPRGKRVVIIGAGKSALDCAAFAATQASHCTLLFRRTHWMLPRYNFGIPTDYLLQSRFSESFLKYHTLNPLDKFMHGIGKPLTRLFWTMQMRMMRGGLNMPDIMVPEHKLPLGLESLGMADEFFAQINAGKVEAKQDSIKSFSENGLVLESGEEIEADVVVFGTGWNQGIDFLSEELNNLVIQDGQFRLYRHILPPAEKHLGFVGYASTFNNTLTAEVAANWLAQVFRGDQRLPEEEYMQKEIDRLLAWIKEYTCRSSGYFLGPVNVHYLDDLIRDMGLPTNRTSNFITEYMGTSWPERYSGLAEERRILREQGSLPSRFYFSALYGLVVLLILLLIL
jgi:cation diffusion facilitator CzcD-associated flavoprotein CzcO